MKNVVGQYPKPPKPTTAKVRHRRYRLEYFSGYWNRADDSYRWLWLARLMARTRSRQWSKWIRIIDSADGDDTQS